LKSKKAHYPIVLVTWDDATNLDLGWSKGKPDPTPHIMFSVGFLLNETDGHLILAMDTDSDGSHNTQGQIPKGMVKSVKILKKANMPKPSEGARVKDDRSQTV